MIHQIENCKLINVNRKTGHWDFGTYSGDYEQGVKGPLTIAFEFNPRAGEEIPNIVDKSKISVSTREAYEVLKIIAQEGFYKCDTVPVAYIGCRIL